MGLTAPTLKYILKTHKKYHFKGPILTLGNQDIYATYDNLVKWGKDIGITKKITAIPSTSRDLITINKQSANFVHAQTFFQLLNIKKSDYYDIDKFDFDSPKIIHDLEQPIPKKYNNFFNLIIDSGTLEHIFDVKSVMDNMVKLLKKNGYILQFIPANNCLNHGFYQFSPTFFYDFYTNNGFKIVESYITEGLPNFCRFHQYQQSRDYTGLFFNPNSRLGNVFLVKKIKENKKIISPTQYIYQKISIDPKKVESDFQKTKFDKLVSWIRSIIPFKYHGLFYKPWRIFKQLFTKKNYFDIDYK